MFFSKTPSANHSLTCFLKQPMVYGYFWIYEVQDYIFDWDWISLALIRPTGLCKCLNKLRGFCMSLGMKEARSLGGKLKGKCRVIIFSLKYLDKCSAGEIKWWFRELSPLKKGKYLYGWPPCPYRLGLGCFDIEKNIQALLETADS